MKVLLFGSEGPMPINRMMFFLQDPGFKAKIRKIILEIADEHGLPEIKRENDLHTVIEIIKSNTLLN